MDDGVVETLQARLEAAEDQAFEGRSAELARLTALLQDPQRLPRLVSVHGPAGIGKTAFAVAAARRSERAGAARSAVLDSRDFPHDLTGLTEALSSRCPWPPAPGEKPVLLALDTFEEMADLEPVLRDQFLPAVGGPALVLLVGRRRASGFLDDPAWRHFVEEIELVGLPRAESLRVAGQHGLTDRTALDRVLGFAGGNPLLLGIAADLAVADPAADLGNPEASPGTAHRLVARMTREIHEMSLRSALEAACVVRTFNEELLSAMVGGEAPTEFQRLCALSFIRLTDTGARVHDLVRRSVAADLRWRAPVRYRELRDRAYRYLQRAVTRARASPPEVEELAFLAGEASFAASFFAPGEQSVQVRSARSEEGDTLLEICRAGVTNLGTSPARRELEVVNDFPVVPDWFLVALDGARAVGFGWTLPLHQESLSSTAAIREPFFNRLPASELAEIQAAPRERPAAFLITGSTFLPTHPHAEAALRQAAFTRRNSHAPTAKRSHLLVPQGSDFEGRATEMGMRRRLTSIRLPGSEQPFDEWLLEYGEGGFTGWVETALGIVEQGGRSGVPAGVPAIQVKAAFEALYDEPELSRSPLTGLLAVRARAGDPAQALRSLLIETVRETESGGRRRDAEAAALLRAYYIRRVGTHEVVAERLGLPRTTFYRRQRQALELVARRLAVGEVALRESGPG